MDISGTLLNNAYAGSYFSGTHPRSPQGHQASSVELVAVKSSVSGIESDSKSASSKQNATATNDRYSAESEPEQTGARSPFKNTNGENTNNPTAQLSEEDLKTVQELKQRDQEVRAHEAAHLAAAGKYATGGASFEYARGPDGKNYAVGGEVGIDTSPVPNDPQATIQKARQIKAAAQAPANPSSTDRQVAANAARMEATARQEVSQQRLEENDDSSIASDNPESEKVDKDDSEPENSKNIAASAYQAIDDISRSERNAESLIELIV